LRPDERLMDLLYARRGSRWAGAALGAVASVRESVRVRRPSRVSVAHDLWIHRMDGVTLVTPGYWTQTPSELDHMLEDELCFQYQPAPGDVVLDIGAGVGEIARPLARRVTPGGRVIAVEAHPDTRRALEMMLAANSIENVDTLGAAAVDRPGPVAIGTGRDWEANSILDGNGADDSVEVPGITIDQLVDDYDLDRIALVKINIEGYEVKALEGMETTLPRCENVVVECHDFLADRNGNDDLRTRSQVEALLDERGFEVTVRPDHPLPWVRDVVYGRRPNHQPC
jgi:FkbM family methyltransferase